MNSMNTTFARCTPESSETALYVATRVNSKPSVAVRTLQGKTELRPRLDLIRHSPVGFDWADGSSSGAAQLALALLAHASGDDDFALEHYQLFKHEIVLRLPKGGWSLNRGQILQMLRFVSVNFCVDPASGQDSCRKTAVICALLPDTNSERVIRAEGIGRSTRGAAIRALLNLLGNKLLRRRPIDQLQIELSVLNTLDGSRPEDDEPDED